MIQCCYWSKLNACDTINVNELRVTIQGNSMGRREVERLVYTTIVREKDGMLISEAVHTASTREGASEEQVRKAVRSLMENGRLTISPNCHLVARKPAVA